MHLCGSRGKGKQKQKPEENRGHPRTPRAEYTRPRHQEREYSQDRRYRRSRSRSPRRPQMDYMGNYQQPVYHSNSEYYSHNRYEPLYYEEREEWWDRGNPAPPIRTPISSKPRGFLGQGPTKGKRKKQQEDAEAERKKRK